MIRNAIQKAVLAVAAGMLTTTSMAAAIGFEAQAGGYGFIPFSFIEDGFRVTYSPIDRFGFYIVDDPADHLGMCGSGCASNGTTAFYAFNRSSVTIDLPDNGAFSLMSLDVAKTFIGNDIPLTLTLTATGVNGVVTSTVFVDARPAEVFSTVTFRDFANISSLTITGGQEFPEFSIDNVMLSPVPEPASWAALVAGLGVMGAIRRRLARRFT